ncbi:rRNA biogenesis protein rrp5 [Tepidanaerobacter sp. EBM-38]|uniref:rRNA biogenesis protein rrp5 n=1 Tax=Tepidanaerobacter sp. EBM-38 TaxID=1918496 RepID=UPI000A45F50D|nr:rRNA biogenesis protein rrp5 [Tepidanaerobacter sp. EBM-38]
MNEIALNIANDLRKLADSIEALTKEEQKSHVANVEELREPATSQKDNLPILEEVRAKLASLSKAGKQAQVRELITGFGVKKLSDIPREKYPELLEKVEVM